MSLPPALESEFELVEELPAGKVFQCYHVKDMRKGGSDAVVRLLPARFSSNQSIVNRFHEFFARFNDIPNRRHVPSVYSVVGVSGRDVYVVEEYCPGVSLSQFVEKNKGSKTFIGDVTEILARVCEGLHHAHQRNIYHLCVLPSDILIDELDYSKVKLVGFGTEVFISERRYNSLSGNCLKYIAPETPEGREFNASADVYSLAASIQDVFPEIGERGDVVDRAMSVKPLERYASAREFAAALKGLEDVSPVERKPKAPAIPGRGPSGGLQPLVKILTDPSGATITVNGKVTGTTTAAGLTVPWKRGKAIEIEKPGFQKEVLTFIEPPDAPEIRIKLRSMFRLFTNPWGATVKINGAQVGVTGRDGLLVEWNRGIIEVHKAGYKPETLKLVTPPQGEYELELKILAPQVAPKRREDEVILKTEPIGAQVRLNKSVFGITTAAGLKIPWKPGNLIEIEKAGFQTKTLHYSYRQNNDEIVVRLEAIFRLVTNPWGATVSVNGKIIGLTTAEGLDVPWDQGEIIVEKADYRTEVLKFLSHPPNSNYVLELKPNVALNGPKKSFKKAARKAFSLIYESSILTNVNQNENPPESDEQKVCEQASSLKEETADLDQIELDGILRAAEAGEPGAQAELGLMFEHGNGMLQDNLQALYWYRKSAEQGHALGQAYLGSMYECGHGVPEDFSQAVYWYRKSAEQGHPLGQACLGVMYENGFGLPVNYDEAVQWYRRSADQGHWYGQKLLGWMYLAGTGVPKDKTTAKMWIRKSDEQFKRPVKF
jgi:TPR repeat protein